MTDIDTFIQDNAQKIFRYCKYKKVFTPYEQDNKFIDESIFEDGGYVNFGYIRQGIELPDGDVLLKIEDTEAPDDLDEDDIENSAEDKFRKFVYIKLSDISLEEYDSDNRKI